MKQPLPGWVTRTGLIACTTACMLAIGAHAAVASRRAGPGEARLAYLIADQDVVVRGVILSAI
ncbi:MAG TPA: hypothetical protein VMS93_07110, partial [Candidatus Saccharimonadales bacterium]|nr:hypothetical protein [Candidatus Saccharimonadales bacterium]